MQIASFSEASRKRCGRTSRAAGRAESTTSRRQVLVPIPWRCDQVDEIRDAVVYVFDVFQKGVDPDLCVARILRPHHAATGAGSAADAPGLSTSSGGGSKLSAAAAPLSIEDWSELIEAFRGYQLLSGEIRGSTWERVYRHHMKHVLGAMAMPSPPQNAKQLRSIPCGACDRRPTLLSRIRLQGKEPRADRHSQS
jgi:hypothetical protein